MILSEAIGLRVRLLDVDNVRLLALRWLLLVYRVETFSVLDAEGLSLPRKIIVVVNSRDLAHAVSRSYRLDGLDWEVGVHG